MPCYTQANRRRQQALDRALQMRLGRLMVGAVHALRENALQVNLCSSCCPQRHSDLPAILLLHYARLKLPCYCYTLTCYCYAYTQAKQAAAESAAAAERAIQEAAEASRHSAIAAFIKRRRLAHLHAAAAAWSRQLRCSPCHAYNLD